MKTIGELIDAGVITRETKVVGELPLTADGCIYGIKAPLVFGVFEGKYVSPAACVAEPDKYDCPECGGNFFSPHECYSTKEAAEAAIAAKEQP